MQHISRPHIIMKLSWEIQRRKQCLRPKVLQSAWAITQNEDITIYYLVKKHSQEKYPSKVKQQELSLFKS